MKLRNDVNEDGIPNTVFNCNYCDQEYSVCPAVSDEETELYDSSGCSAPGCDSYDPKRDVDILFMDNRQLADHADKVKAVDIKMLAKRRKFQSGVKFEDLED